MPSKTHTPCFELVLSWLPFPPAPAQKVLIEHLCACGVNPRQIVWLIILILVGSEPQEAADPEKPAKPTPLVWSDHFPWDVWLEICDEIKEQSLILSPYILKQVFLQVLAGKILTLTDAMDLIHSLLASTYDGGSGAGGGPGGTIGSRSFKR